MKLKEIARRLWRSFEALAEAADYDPLTDIASRVERLERTVAELRKPAGTSA
ncbi:hypothetical protein [Sphingomonas sp. MS122]|uniref:hypothetical protein n=1 Tax=Sphingomonas sp. MS122 TaxID=3412683 RepID=UPI003C2B98F6